MEGQARCRSIQGKSNAPSRAARPAGLLIVWAISRCSARRTRKLLLHYKYYKQRRELDGMSYEVGGWAEVLSMEDVAKAVQILEGDRLDAVIRGCLAALAASEQTRESQPFRKA